MNRHPAVVAYDIRCNNSRRRVLKILHEWRLDGQYSVHECLLAPAEAEELFLQLSAAIDIRHDRLLLAWLAPGRPVSARGTGRTDALFRPSIRIR